MTFDQLLRAQRELVEVVHLKATKAGLKKHVMLLLDLTDSRGRQIAEGMVGQEAVAAKCAEADEKDALPALVTAVSPSEANRLLEHFLPEAESPKAIDGLAASIASGTIPLIGVASEELVVSSLPNV